MFTVLPVIVRGGPLPTAAGFDRISTVFFVTATDLQTPKIIRDSGAE